MGNHGSVDRIWSGSSVMKSKDCDNILELLGIMVKTELLIAKFYRSCAHIWGKDKAFWLGLEGDEKLHANNIREMAKIVIEKFDLFECNRPFNPVAMKTINSGIETNIQRLKSGKISEDKVLYIARDIEQSLIESKYDEIVKTSDVEYQTLVKKITAQTIAHHHKIEKKIENIEREQKASVSKTATSF